MIVTVRTNVTPTFSYDSSQPPSGFGGSILRALQPSVQASGVPILGDVNYEPFGPPSGVGWVVVLLLGGLAIYGGYKLTKKYL